MLHINGSEIPSTLGTLKGFPIKLVVKIEVINNTRAPGAALFNFLQGDRVVHKANIPVNPMTGFMADSVVFDMGKVNYEPNIPVRVEWCGSHRGVLVAFHSEERGLITVC